MRKITEECKEKLQQCLKSYVEDTRGINREKKFRCFNSVAHNNGDSSPSAAIVPGSKEKFWTCFACGAKGDIFKAVECEENISSFSEQVKYIAARYNLELKYDREKSIKKKIVKTYYYENEKNEVVYKIERREWSEKGIRKKDFLPYRKEKSNWQLGLKNVSRVLYRLPRVMKAVQNGELIFFVEGEKCVERLEALGVTATTSCSGAKSWCGHASEYTTFLKSASVVIIPDNDEPGFQYARRVAEDLKIVASCVKIVELYGLESGEDIVEWLEKGGGKEALMELAESSKPWQGDSEIITDKNHIDNAALRNEEEKESSVAFGTVFEKNNKYCKNYKEREKAISNFVLEPKYIIEGNSSTEIQCIVLNSEGIPMERTMDLSAFNDVTDFRESINNLNFSYAGNVEDLQYIRDIVARKPCIHIKGVEYCGFHNLDGSWNFVSREGAVNGEGAYNNNVVLMREFEELSTDILSFEEISREELKELGLSLFKFNSLAIAATIIGYVSGLFLKGKLNAEKIKYNHLIIEGQSGSGKSQTIESVILPILCASQAVLDAGECTAFALNRAASSNNFIPLILDEYKPQKIGIYKVNLISNIMRNSYDGHRAIKGVASLKKNKEFISRVSVILSGEVGTTETANMERSLRLIFSKSTHSEESTKALCYLKENSKLLNKLGRSLLSTALKKDNHRLKLLHLGICKEAAGKSIKDDRVRNSVTNCIMGLVLLKECFENLDLNFNKTTEYTMAELIAAVKKGAYEDLLDGGKKSKSVIFHSLETMNRMAINGQLLANYDYDVVIDTEGDLVLRLNYNAFYDRFIKYCEDYHVEHEFIPITSFKKQLGKMDYCKSFNRIVRFSKGISDKQAFRSAVLKVKPLLDNNLEIDFMLSGAGDKVERHLNKIKKG